jgi:hypothetical protein
MQESGYPRATGPAIENGPRPAETTIVNAPGGSIDVNIHVDRSALGEFIERHTAKGTFAKLVGAQKAVFAVLAALTERQMVDNCLVYRGDKKTIMRFVGLKKGICYDALGHLSDASLAIEVADEIRLPMPSKPPDGWRRRPPADPKCPAAQTGLFSELPADHGEETPGLKSALLNSAGPEFNSADAVAGEIREQAAIQSAPLNSACPKFNSADKAPAPLNSLSNSAGAATHDHDQNENDHDHGSAWGRDEMEKILRSIRIGGRGLDPPGVQRLLEFAPPRRRIEAAVANTTRRFELGLVNDPMRYVYDSITNPNTKLSKSAAARPQESKAPKTIAPPPPTQAAPYAEKKETARQEAVANAYLGKLSSDSSRAITKEWLLAHAGRNRLQYVYETRCFREPIVSAGSDPPPPESAQTSSVASTATRIAEPASSAEEERLEQTIQNAARIAKENAARSAPHLESGFHEALQETGTVP